LRQYETTFVIDSLLKGGEIDEIIKRYERFISANGGDVQRVQRWGKKRLAYGIKKRQYGYYVHMRFEGPGSIIKPLEREYLLNESILRYLTVTVEKQALKAEAQRKEKAAADTKAVAIAEEEPLDSTIAAPGEENGDTDESATVGGEMVSEEAATDEGKQTAAETSEEVEVEKPEEVMVEEAPSQEDKQEAEDAEKEKPQENEEDKGQRDQT
jgi:small subunit ribosomal protein S6